MQAVAEGLAASFEQRAAHQCVGGAAPVTKLDRGKFRVQFPCRLGTIVQS
jgi:hypothetical protein